MYWWNMNKQEGMGFGPDLGHLVWHVSHPNNEMGIKVVVAARDAKDYSYGS